MELEQTRVQYLQRLSTQCRVGVALTAVLSSFHSPLVIRHFGLNNTERWICLSGWLLGLLAGRGVSCIDILRQTQM